MLLSCKIVIVPTLIALVTFAGRRWGTHLSGVLAGLPLIVGPILVFLALEQGNDFAAAAAHAALAGVISIGLFCFVYAHVSGYWGEPISLFLSLLAFALSTLLLSILHLEIVLTLLIVVLALAAFIFAFPRVVYEQKPIETSCAELSVRMATAVLLVVLVTSLSATIGAQLSGLLAPFPIVGTVLAGFTHRSHGALAARSLLIGFIRGLYGMAMFSFTFAAALPGVGLLATLLIALTLTLAVSVITIRVTGFACR